MALRDRRGVQAAIGGLLAQREFEIVFLVLAPGFLGLHLDQALPVGDRDLIVVRMDFAEGEEAVPIAAVFDERGLQAGLYPDDLGEIDVAFELAFG